MNFEKIVEDFLSPKSNSAKLYETACDYYKLLSEFTGISGASENPADDQTTFLKTGKAISPKDAARCVLDYRRTAGFLQGIYSAIKQSQLNFPGEKIEILYAGCGPFAALALPQCAKFGSDEIAFTLIDIHQRSLDSARTIFEKFGFENYVGEFIKTDASVYQNEHGKKFHIIVTETMQKSLEKEPQAAITLNLANQLRKNGIFIPQKITVSACLAKPELEFDAETKDKERIYLGNILELSVGSKGNFPPQTVTMPLADLSGRSFMLMTHIQIFEDKILLDYNSGISYPTILNKIELKKGRTIEFKYMIGKDPHFEYKYI